MDMFLKAFCSFEISAEFLKVIEQVFLFYRFSPNPNYFQLAFIHCDYEMCT